MPLIARPASVTGSADSALLTGISVDYARLERGNLTGVSEDVLDSLARALLLDEAETQHLHDLTRAAHPLPTRGRKSGQDHTVRPSLQRFLDAITDAPAATLRTYAGQNPLDRELTDLIGELVTRNDTFRRRWSAHNVRLHCTGTKRIHHPDLGDLEFVYEGMDLPGTPDWTLYALTTEPGSPTEERMRLLGSLAATPVPSDQQKRHR